MPRDWCCSVHYDPATGFGWAGGYTGHGVVTSNVLGRTLADLVLQRDSDLVSLPWVGHESPRWEPEPLRFIASRAIVTTLGSADRAEDRRDRPARRTRLVQPVHAGPLRRPHRASADRATSLRVDEKARGGPVGVAARLRAVSARAR